MALISRVNQKAKTNIQTLEAGIDFNSALLIETLIEQNHNPLCDLIRGYISLKQYRALYQKFDFTNDYHHLIEYASVVAEKLDCKVINDVHLVLATFNYIGTAYYAWGRLNPDIANNLRHQLTNLAIETRDKVENTKSKDFDDEEEDKLATVKLNTIIDILQDNLKQRTSDEDAIAKIKEELVAKETSS